LATSLTSCCRCLWINSLAFIKNIIFSSCTYFHAKSCLLNCFNLKSFRHNTITHSFNSLLVIFLIIIIFLVYLMALIESSPVWDIFYIINEVCILQRFAKRYLQWPNLTKLVCLTHSTSAVVERTWNYILVRLVNANLINYAEHVQNGWRFNIRLPYINWPG